MKRTNRELSQILDDTLAEVRAERLDDSTVTEATTHVWRRISAEESALKSGVVPVEHIRGCADFQALIPSYLDATLSPARALLLEDHTHECIPCRKALKEARALRRGEVTASRPRVSGQRKPMSPPVRWAIAAALTVGLGLVVYPWVQRFTRTVGTFHTIVQASNGNVYRITETATQPVKTGDKIALGERVRAAKDSSAVLVLGDGSQVELRERSELWVAENGQGTTVHLDRGQVVVEAAKQRNRHLYVATDDSLVAVNGTIFSVNNGTKGARISVIEGEVNVDHSGTRSILRSGDQLATHASIDQVTVKDEVKWSKSADKYSRILDDVAALRKQIDSQVARPGVRYSTRLLDLAPADTLVYVAIPNISQMLGDANRILESKLAENPQLREWWQKEHAKNKQGFNETINRVREFGSYLGPEIVLSVGRDGKGDMGVPIVLAELQNAAGFQGFLQAQLDTVRGPDNKGPKVRLLTDSSVIPGTVKGEDDELFVWMKDDLIAASPRAESIAQLASILKAPDSNGFKSTPFHALLSEIYVDGAGLVIAADLEKIIGQQLREDGKPSDREAAQKLGLLNAKYFVAELKEKDGRPSNKATLTFSEKRGLSSWLSSPGPMGALDFISSEASVVAAFVVERPVSLVDDVLGALQSADPQAYEQLKQFESQYGFNLREDFAAPLGGEFAFALDGPVLPLPAWKAVIEVNDQQKLQESFERTVVELNRFAATQGKLGFEWRSEQSGERIFYILKSRDFGVGACYTFAYGYLIAAPSRALVEQAIQHHDAGTSVLNSPRFKSTLPEDKQANFSAMFFYNLGPAMAPLAKQGIPVPKGPINFDKPLLAYVYSLGDRFTLSASTEDGPIGLTPSMLVGLPGPFGLHNLVK
jgi:FecR protein/Putative zinc-finger